MRQLDGKVKFGKVEKPGQLTYKWAPPAERGGYSTAPPPKGFGIKREPMSSEMLEEARRRRRAL